LCEGVECTGPSRLEIGFRRRRRGLRLNRAQIGLPAGVHQSAGRTQIFLGRHDGIFKKRGACLRDLGSSVGDREIVAEIDGNLTISCFRSADARFASCNPRAALPPQLDRLVDGQR
jgi:hypothetical protein